MGVKGFDEVGVYPWVEPLSEVDARLVTAVAQYCAEQVEQFPQLVGVFGVHE